jgi:hypothetical protein
MPVVSAAALLLVASSASYAQSASITGMVLDARTGRPLPRVVVGIEAESQSVETDATGSSVSASFPDDMSSRLPSSATR